jgi:hypothetical protein
MKSHLFPIRQPTLVFFSTPRKVIETYSISSRALSSEPPRNRAGVEMAGSLPLVIHELFGGTPHGPRKVVLAF